LRRLFGLGAVATVSFFGSLPIEEPGFFTLRGHSLLEAVACLFASYRRRERAWRWTVLVLLGLFLLFGLAPV
jgi:hypothetical protein